mmetsp:Transcript_135578/g.270483  ORF Transcript_135578/g.270483 Transcript_135578/m.270483 type:complete len:284 (+) Transcript_135578:472-1323(+)
MKRATHSTMANEPRRRRGNPAMRSTIASSTLRKPSFNSVAVSMPAPARSARPPGASTRLSKLKQSGSSMPPSPQTASWQDIPPPESIPASSVGHSWLAAACAVFVLKVWIVAAHSARASASPLNKLKLARQPSRSCNCEAKSSSCACSKSPLLTASRTPAVAPTSTRPAGSFSSSNPIRLPVCCSLHSASANGSPRQLDFCADSVSAWSCDSAWCEKETALVAPLPQSTTEIGIELNFRRSCALGNNQSKPRAASAAKEEPIWPNLGSKSCSGVAGAEELCSE